ncbi:hypothetical protein C427_5293 [Paraglaciecola psychrophila 170]|uniref:Uncharacterized protein n=1 Tax=Paraglaciecola psychrophila 170 TaxID=1129794 RepID=K6ZKH4_9ALTE|nr:hypothetical protein C427_5293 [Paraglaciecola psychrophila 170]GAC36481.1 hypothetical protein GPSY_0843 [Paraglaciecola psychrophila 170]
MEKRDPKLQNGALIFLDLFKFEVINQRFSWDAGDYFLN